VSVMTLAVAMAIVGVGGWGVAILLLGTPYARACTWSARIGMMATTVCIVGLLAYDAIWGLAR